MTTVPYPPAVQAQVASLLDIIRALLGTNLVGVYAASTHSGTPTEAVPLLQVLVLTARDVRHDTKYGLVQTFLRHATQPAALDVLVIRETDVQTAQPSSLVQLHFTAAQHAQLTAEVGSATWLQWPDGPTGSVDRASQLGQFAHAGRTLFGRPLADVLVAVAAPTVPDRSSPPPQGPPSSSRQLPLT